MVSRYREYILNTGRASNLFRGLGDPVFEMVFRRYYEGRIRGVSQQEVDEGVRKELESAKGLAAHYKGLTAEYAIVHRLLTASLNHADLSKVVDQDIAPTPLGPFKHLQKKTFHLEQQEKIEVDAFLEHQDAAGPHIVLEVKNWTDPVHQTAAEAFLDKKRKLETIVPENTFFLLYAENGLAPEAKQILQNHGALTTTAKRLL